MKTNTSLLIIEIASIEVLHASGISEEVVVACVVILGFTVVVRLVENLLFLVDEVGYLVVGVVFGLVVEVTSVFVEVVGRSVGIVGWLSGSLKPVYK